MPPDSPAPSGAGTASATSQPVEAPAAQTTINLICIKVLWEGAPRIQSLDSPFHDVLVRREVEHPKGRKGLTLARAWEQMSGPDDAGMLILDGDVVIDPVDLNTMIMHVASDRGSVWVAPTKLWPVSTHLPSWVWGHRKIPPEGMSQGDVMKLWQTDVEDPDYYTFCLSFLPRFLVETAIDEGLKEWHYPNVDKNMHELTKKLGISVRVVRGDCHPTHVNWK